MVDVWFDSKIEKWHHLNDSNKYIDADKHGILCLNLHQYEFASTRACIDIGIAFITLTCCLFTVQRPVCGKRPDHDTRKSKLFPLGTEWE